MKNKLIGLIFLVIFSVINLTPVEAGVNDFYFDKLHTDYYLTKDADGRSRVKVVENFDTVFPNPNTNHGIVRNLKTIYQNHPVGLNVKSVKINGNEAQYKESLNDDILSLKIGDANKYLYGNYKIEIVYYMKDVILSPDNNSNIQEFYWNVNGTV